MVHSRAAALKLSTGRAGRLARAGLALALLGGCASLPTKETAAFKTIAAGGVQSFSDLTTATNQALGDTYLDRLARGQVRLNTSSGCLASPTDDKATCVIGVAPLGAGAPAANTIVALSSSAPDIQALLAAVNTYAGGMSELAAAKDLADASAAVGKVTTSLSSIAKLIPGGGGVLVGPALNALKVGAGELAVERRRALMLNIATQAQPVIDAVTTKLNDESVQFRAILVEARTGRFVDLTQEFITDEGLARDSKPHLNVADRRKLLQAINEAANAANAARRLPVDFKDLKEAHEATVEALRNPKADLASAVAKAQQFIDVITAFQTAAAGGATAAKPATPAKS